MASEIVKASRPRVPRPNPETGEGRSADEWLAEAAERVAAAAHAARRDPATTPQDVCTRVGSLVDLVAKLEQHLRGSADVLDVSAGRPGLRSSDPAVDPRGVAGHAAWRLRSLAADLYLSGLVHQLDATHAELASLSEASAGGEEAAG